MYIHLLPRIPQLSRPADRQTASKTDEQALEAGNEFWWSHVVEYGGNMTYMI